MAKKKKKSPPRPRLWEAHPDDAIRLAALRWFAIEIERIAIEVYATNRRSYSHLEGVLRETMRNMGTVRRDFGTKQDEDCPIGYVLCKDGVCAPMCDGFIGTESDS